MASLIYFLSARANSIFVPDESTSHRPCFCHLLAELRMTSCLLLSPSKHFRVQVFKSPHFFSVEMNDNSVVRTRKSNVWLLRNCCMQCWIFPRQSHASSQRSAAHFERLFAMFFMPFRTLLGCGLSGWLLFTKKNKNLSCQSAGCGTPVCMIEIGFGISFFFKKKTSRLTFWQDMESNCSDHEYQCWIFASRILIRVRKQIFQKKMFAKQFLLVSFFADTSWRFLLLLSKVKIFLRWHWKPNRRQRGEKGYRKQF